MNYQFSEFTNRYGERAIYVHDGECGVVYHSDNLISKPIRVRSPKDIRPGCGAAVVDDVILSLEEARWLRKCIATSLEVIELNSAKVNEPW